MKTKKGLKIAIASGKGGVGKSMLTSSLAMLFSQKKKVVAVDCDADAANLAIWLNEADNWEKVKRISVSEKPVIDNSKLGKGDVEQCVQKCKFGALYVKNTELKLNPFLCEGCGACEMFCPKGAIKMTPIKNAEIRIKEAKYGFPLVAGQLFPGQTGSGKIVTEIKKEAEKFIYQIMLIDSAPGTGCPVTAALRDANFVILVTEPTLSGFSDLKKVLEVVDYFRIPFSVVINKWGVNLKMGDKIRRWAGDKFLGKISYDKRIFKTVSQLTPIMETDLKAKEEIIEIYHKLILNFDL